MIIKGDIYPLLIQFFYPLMELFLKPNTPETFLIELVVDYLKLQQKNKVQIVNLSRGALIAIAEGKLKLGAPALITTTGEIIEDPIAIVKALVGETQWVDFFFGDSAESREQISKAESHIKPAKEQLKYLQKYLQPRTFFAGNHLTFADLLVFTKVHDVVSEFDNDNKSGFCNVFRWFKNIQNQPGIKEFLVKAGKGLVTEYNPTVSFVEKKKK